MDGSAEQRSGAYERQAAALGRLFEDTADDLAGKLPPPGERILDIGTGSGVWSLAMGARSARARVSGLDLAAVLPAFLDRAERLGLADRVQAIAGDYHFAELPVASFDRIVLANVLHLESPPDAAALIARAAAALAPGGELVVIDSLAEDDPSRSLGRAIYALHLAMRTDRGQVHPRAEIERWARAAGLSHADLITPDAPPWNTIALVHRAE